MLRLARYLKYYKKEAILGPIFKWMEAVFELIVPLVMARIIDVGIKNGDTAYVLKMGGLMVLLGLLGLCFALFCQYSASKASQGIGTIMRNDLFRHINTLTHGELDAIGTNSLVTRITNDVNQMQTAVAMLIRLVVRAPFLVIGATVMAMLLDLKLSLVFLVVAPLVSLVLYLVMSHSVPFYKIRQKKLDKISLITRENLSGVRVIRAFSKQKSEEARFDEASDDLTGIMIRVGKISAVLNPATFLIMNGAIVAILWFGGIRVDKGVLSQGQMIAFVNYMTQISLALVVVANLVVIFTKAAASAARINEIFDLEPSIREGSLPQQAGKTGVPKVEFRNVSFSYTKTGDNALEQVSFCAMPGETIGIIGGTGSGKSTLVNLIPRFYEVSQGEILVDGRNISEYTFDGLRGQMGIVPQRAVLFQGSIKKNLRWGKEDADMEELNRAADIAQAKEFIDKQPEGYETILSQGGKNLSGGQRQRLAIARALVGNPEILILDDSSSALDYATDARLRMALKEKLHGCTVFLVSQRANSIKYADKIIVLEEGKVAGIGTHQELMKSCMVYQEICLSQLKREEA